MTEFQEAQEGFRGAILRAHDDAVRLAYETGRKHGAAEEREACAKAATDRDAAKIREYLDGCATFVDPYWIGKAIGLSADRVLDVVLAADITHRWLQR